MIQFDRSEVARLATRMGLGLVASDLAALVEPAGRIEVSPTPKAKITGGSKLGGLPDLPADVPWPVHDGSPAVFVAQISLAEAHFLSVPGGNAGGLLSLFLSRDAPTGEIADGVVLLTSGEAELRPRAHPAGERRTDLLSERQATLRPELTLPRWGGRQASPLASLDLIDVAREQYNALLDRLEAGQGLRGPRHRLLGHPREIDDDVLVEAALMSFWQEQRGYGGAELEAEARNWRLLAQFDTDRRFGFPFARGKATYFCIPSRAGAATFRRAQAIARPPEPSAFDDRILANC